MKKALCIASMLALASVAFASTPAGSATIFITNSADPYGLVKAENAFVATQQQIEDGGTLYNVDLIDLGDGPAYSLKNSGDMTAAMPTIDPTAGEFGYIWIKFDQTAKNAKVQGLSLEWSNATDVCYYVLRDDFTDNWTRRWEGPVTEPTVPEYHQNPQVLAAVTSNGLKIADGQQLQAFYGNETGTLAKKSDTVFLLGAIAFEEGMYDATGLLPQAINFSGQLDTDPVFPVTVMGAHIVPEPASLLLIGLAGLLIRRR